MTSKNHTVEKVQTIHKGDLHIEYVCDSSDKDKIVNRKTFESLPEQSGAKVTKARYFIAGNVVNVTFQNETNDSTKMPFVLEILANSYIKRCTQAK